MPFVLGVDHANPQHRLLKTMQLAVDADGTALVETPESAPGRRRFTVPDGAGAVNLAASVAAAAGSSSTKKILDLKQTFSVLRDLSGTPLLVPDPPRHARVQPITGWGVPAEKGRIIRLRLELGFLDLTDRARNLQGVITAGGPTNPPPRAFDLQPPAGSRVVVLESTERSPFAWLAFLPPAVTTAETSVGALVFLRPTFKPPFAYADADDVQLMNLGTRRYFLDARATPPFGLGDPGAFPRYQSIGFERQLVASGKKVVLLWPLPRGSGYGAIETGGLPALAEAVVTALAGEGHVGATAKLTRLAVSGYSHGGKVAMAAFNAGRAKDRIDELYLFDPASFVGPPDRNWLNSAATAGGAARRVRMIGGGYQHGAMLAHERTLGRNANATCWPPQANFWSVDADYHRGLSDVQGQIRRFDPVASAGAPTPGGASAKSGIFLVSDTSGANPPTTTRLALRAVLAGGATASGAVSGVAHEEAASIVHAHSINAVLPVGTPVSTSARMQQIVANITANENGSEPDRIRALRHEWCVFGGLSLGAGYKGFFQHCLEQSGF